MTVKGIVAGVFKKNDIRGTFDVTLTTELIIKIGYVISQILGENKTVVIAGDSRLSTPNVKESIAKGLTAGGYRVYDAGIGPTPMVYFISKRQKDIELGIMITASHNPPGDNGIKICDENGHAYHYDNLYQQIESQVKDYPSLHDIPIREDSKRHPRYDLADEYYEYLFDQFTFKNRLAVAVEFGNGAAGKFVDVLKKLNCQVLSIREKPDGNFPTLLPDPMKEVTYDELVIALQSGDYDIGLAFDGDGDRIGFITAQGKIIPPDLVIMIFAGERLEKYGSANILIDVKISKAAIDYIERKGGNVNLTQVGHSWVHENLLKTKSDIAAELSCHYYFEDEYFGFDDGLYAGLRFLRILDTLKEKNQSIEDLITELPMYASTKEFREPMPTTKQENILKNLMEFTNDNKGKLITIDGIRGEFENSWFIARKSGTEEALSYRIEGKTVKDRDRLLQQVKDIINHS
ncbi:MAG: phosphomannomutase/phosphoglucomutase [Candidatus Kariarchaeaceae archaeon]|jgi:phosphomannomutase